MACFCYTVVKSLHTYGSNHTRVPLNNVKTVDPNFPKFEEIKNITAAKQFTEFIRGYYDKNVKQVQEHFKTMKQNNLNSANPVDVVSVERPGGSNELGDLQAREDSPGDVSCITGGDDLADDDYESIRSLMPEDQVSHHDANLDVAHTVSASVPNSSVVTPHGYMSGMEEVKKRRDKEQSSLVARSFTNKAKFGLHQGDYRFSPY